jgi:hypothetical protein
MSEVRNVATFNHPLYAIRPNQQPVKILAIGDEQGKSPVYLTVDEMGRSTWQSVNELRIIDMNVLPFTAETFRTVTQQQTTR